MPVINRSVAFILIVGAVLLFIIVLPACNSFHRNKSHAAVPTASIKEGKALAEVYCQSCHMLPDPAQVNAGSWEKGVLPNMGPRLGIFQHYLQFYPSGRNDPTLKGFYPEKPVLTPTQWQHIINYYSATSPDTL